MKYVTSFKYVTLLKMPRKKLEKYMAMFIIVTLIGAIYHLPLPV